MLGISESNADVMGKVIAYVTISDAWGRYVRDAPGDKI